MRLHVIAVASLLSFSCGGSGGGGGTAPSAPTGVTATAGDGEVTLSWNPVSGATSYNLYASTSQGVTTSNGTKTAGVTSPYRQTNLTNGAPYYFVVTAVNSHGESDASAQVSATPAVPTLSADQAVFEQFLLSPAVTYGLNWHLPWSGAPLAGTHWLGETHGTMTESPLTNGTQTIQFSALADLTSTPLGFPSASTYTSPYHPPRYLVGGAILVSSEDPDANEHVSYSGSGVRLDILDSTGTTVVASYLRSGITSNPLTGTIASAPTDFTRYFSVLYFNSALLNPAASWSSGAAYEKYTSTYVGDTYEVHDWSTTQATNGNTPLPAATGTSVSNVITSTSGLTSTADGITYTLQNGSISTINGVKTYVASVPRPNMTTTAYHTFYDLNGNVYAGQLYKDGTITGGTVYRIGATYYYDMNFGIRLNAAAASSLKAALTF